MVDYEYSAMRAQSIRNGDWARNRTAKVSAVRKNGAERAGGNNARGQGEQRGTNRAARTGRDKVHKRNAPSGAQHA